MFESLLHLPLAMNILTTCAALTTIFVHGDPVPTEDHSLRVPGKSFRDPLYAKALHHIIFVFKFDEAIKKFAGKKMAGNKLEECTNPNPNPHAYTFKFLPSCEKSKKVMDEHAQSEAKFGRSEQLSTWITKLHESSHTSLWEILSDHPTCSSKVPEADLSNTLLKAGYHIMVFNLSERKPFITLRTHDDSQDDLNLLLRTNEETGNFITPTLTIAGTTLENQDFQLDLSSYFTTAPKNALEAVNNIFKTMRYDKTDELTAGGTSMYLVPCITKKNSDVRFNERAIEVHTSVIQLKYKKMCYFGIHVRNDTDNFWTFGTKFLLNSVLKFNLKNGTVRVRKTADKPAEIPEGIVRSRTFKIENKGKKCWFGCLG